MMHPLKVKVVITKKPVNRFAAQINLLLSISWQLLLLIVLA